jgi:hypothetical protein
MVIEPPCEFGSGGVLKIDDGVLVAVEQGVVKALRGSVSHTRVGELRAWVEAVSDESREERRRSRAIEAVVVIQNSDSHEKIARREENLSVCIRCCAVVKGKSCPIQDEPEGVGQFQHK